MKQQGFSLVEFLIYTLISAVLLVVVARFVVSAIGYRHHSARQELRQARLAIVHDTLARDIAYASADATHWHLTENQLVMVSESRHIRWMLEKKSLYRDSDGKRALIMNGITTFSATLALKEGGVGAVGITVQPEGSDQPIAWCFSVLFQPGIS